MTDKELPEAPASVTYSITTKDGYNALFTIRDVSGLGLLDKMATIEKKQENMTAVIFSAP